MKKLSKILTVVLIIALTGCVMGPDFEKPVVGTPGDYRFADLNPKTVVNLKWWELFNDPVLESLVAEALDNNKDLLIATSRIEEARAFLGFTSADLYPRIDIGGSASRGNLLGDRRAFDTETNYFIAPAMSWEVDFWGRVKRSTESARAELMASEYSLRTVQISLISEVVSTYFLLLDFHQRLGISKRTLETRLESLDIIQKRFDGGIVPEIDLNQAQVQLETAATAIPLFERAIARTESTLSILLGKFPDAMTIGTGLRHQTIPPDIPVGLPGELLERRPDILQAQHILHAQTARIGIAEALRFPTINLTGILGGASDDLSDLTSGGAVWSISGSLTGPIIDFDQSKLRVVIEKERTKQALYQYENTVLLAFREVEDSLNAIDTFKRQAQAAKRKLKAAQNAADLSKKRYDKGVTSFLEVLDTERDLFEVALEVSELDQESLNSYVRLYKSLGGGWLSEEEMQQVSNAADNDNFNRQHP